MAPQPSRPQNRNDFKVAVICALPFEAGMVQNVFDKEWDIGADLGKTQGDHNAYSFGIIGRHNIVLVHMPGIGSIDGATVAVNIRTSFPNIEIAFLVGICGASPKNTVQEDVFLGDCIVSTAVIQYDFGRQYPGHFNRKTDLEDALSRASPTIRGFLAKLQATQTSQTLGKRLTVHLKSVQQKVPKALYPGLHRDRLFRPTYLHTHHDTEKRCDQCVEETGVCTMDCDMLGCDETQIVERINLTTSKHSTANHLPQLHFGRYGSANTVLKSGIDRDHYTKVDNVIGFEMEGAGIWETIPTIIVKSACDYADSHKNKEWQMYAAATAASGLKAILEQLTTTDLPTRQDDTKISGQVSFNIPNSLVAHFVYRKEILTEIDKWMNNTEDRAKLVLRGMGGAGKSQLALECCRKAEVSKQFTTVFWIDASSVLSVQQSFKLLVSELEGCSDVSDDSKSIVNLVTQALRRRGGRWFAVFDNFDSPNVFQYDPITNYIPTAEDGKILFTSRDATSNRLGRVISISKMTDRESLELLLKRSPQDLAEEEIGLRIAVELGHLALALDQAEAYIRSRNLPLEDFVIHFRERKKTILSEIPQHWEYRTNKTTEQSILLSAFITWELSFEQISGSSEIKQSKGHFLTLCAFFDPMSISEEYFEFYCQTTKNGWTSVFKSETTWDSFLFGDVTAECKALSLLQSDEEHDRKGSLVLHPLIREWLKLRMTLHEQQKMAEEFTDLLVSYIEAVDLEYSELSVRQKLLANIISCTQEDERFRSMRSADYPSSFAEIFSQVYWESGFYDEAEQLQQQALANYQEKFGFEHPDTLAAMHYLAIIYKDRGKYDKAEQLYKQVLAGHEKLGFRQIDTSSVIHDLAIVYKLKGRYDEAEQLFKQVLAVRKEELEPEHPDTLRTMEGLGNIFDRKGRYGEAEKLYRQVLAARQEKLGPKHPDTLRIMRSLAITNRHNDKNDEAEKLFMEVLTGYQEKFDPKHPRMLRAMNSLACTYYDQEKYNEAEKLYMEVLVGHQEKFDSKHPDILRAINNLACTYYLQGKYNEAEKLWMEALVGYQEKLGPEHPETIDTMRNLEALSTQKNCIPVQCASGNSDEPVASVLEDRNQRQRVDIPKKNVIEERKKKVNSILALSFAVTRRMKQRLGSKP